jgi:hypothetical protein
MSAPLAGVWYPYVLSERLPACGDRLERSGFSSSTKRSFWPPILKALPTLGNNDVTIILRDATDGSSFTAIRAGDREQQTMTEPEFQLLPEDPFVHKFRRAAMSEVNGRSSPSAKRTSPHRHRRAIIITTLVVAALVTALALLGGAEGVAAGALVVAGVWLARYWRHSR